jgi:endonuclease-3
MKSPVQALGILRKLEQQHPNADTALRYRDAFELLVATILSAQTTDAGVNEVTPALFARYPDAAALAAADPADVESIVKRTGFFRQKAGSIIGMAAELVKAHDGTVPAEMEALVRLPGVGRKTANVVLSHALGVPGLPVDRHVLRVANRIGLASSDDPEVVERQLGALYPPAAWRSVSDTLILHGRRICNPKPLCDRCSLREDCEAYQTGLVAPAGGSPLPGNARRASAARPRKVSTARAPKPAPARTRKGARAQAVPAPRATPPGRTKPAPGRGGTRTRGK